jgi:hypothetical protein
MPPRAALRSQLAAAAPICDIMVQLSAMENLVMQFSVAPQNRLQNKHFRNS